MTTVLHNSPVAGMKTCIAAKRCPFMEGENENNSHLMLDKNDSDNYNELTLESKFDGPFGHGLSSEKTAQREAIFIKGVRAYNALREFRTNEEITDEEILEDMYDADERLDEIEAHRIRIANNTPYQLSENIDADRHELYVVTGEIAPQTTLEELYEFVEKTDTYELEPGTRAFERQRKRLWSRGFKDGTKLLPPMPDTFADTTESVQNIIEDLELY